MIARISVHFFGKTYGGFKQWTAASTAMVIGFVIFSNRLPAHPSLGIMISIPLFMSVIPLHFDGLLEFLMPEAKQLRRTGRWAILLAIAAFEMAYISEVSDKLMLLIIFGTIDVFNMAIVVVAVRDLRRGGLTAMWLVAGCSFLSLMLQLARIGVIVTRPDANALFMAEQALAWSCISATIQQMLVAIAQFTLVAQRVRTDLEAARGELEKLAWTDSLTGLRNRRRFIEDSRTHFDSARRHNRPLALLMCDLDHFKQINDTFGHAIGDRVLEKVGRALADMARLSDCAGRIGGEEFAILLTETDMATAQLVAERFRCGVEAILPPEPGPVQITTSIGIATLQPDDATIEFLMERADQALYRAKAAGRNCSMTLEASPRSYSDLRLS